MTTPITGSRVRVQTAEVRGVGVVVEVNERHGYCRVHLNSGVRCSVHHGEYEPIPTSVRHDEVSVAQVRCDEPQGSLELV